MEVQLASPAQSVRAVPATCSPHFISINPDRNAASSAPVMNAPTNQPRWPLPIDLAFPASATRGTEGAAASAESAAALHVCRNPSKD